MKFFAAFVFCLVLCVRLGAEELRLSQPTPGKDPNNPANFAVVVYNANDPLAEKLAQYYAERRNIPFDRVVALRCALVEEINRDEFDRDIVEPLRKVFDERHWWERSKDHPGANPSSIVMSTRVRFLVLMRGIPLKIAHRTVPYEGDNPGNQPDALKNTNAASVDSELAVLGAFTRTISGVIVNPYFRSFARIHETNYPWLMVVGRLDGPSDAVVRRMIDDAVEVEKTGLWGRAYFDARGLAPESGALYQGDAWLVAASKESNLPAVLDLREALFEHGYPMNECALYLGWYAPGVNGPFSRPDWRFQRGALAIHLHSFSASTIREAGNGWVAPLLAAGAAASCGNVYEPYLNFTVHFDVMLPRLQAGFTFGESAYMATPAVSWMGTVVGDPLYRPFKAMQELCTRAELSLVRPETDFASDSPNEAETKAFVATWHLRRSKPVNAIELEVSKLARKFKSGRIYEGLGLAQLAGGDVSTAIRTLETARDSYASPDDVQRVILHLARAQIRAGRKPQALVLARQAITKFPTSPAVECFRALERELEPPPTPAPTGTAGAR